MRKMKKVLIIAQYFPPAGGVGSIRVTKFVKYLRAFGWEPIVLTVRNSCYSNNIWLDQGLMEDIPGDISIYRTGIWKIKAINNEGVRWLPFLLSAVGKLVNKEKPKLVYLTGGPFFPLLAGPFVYLLFKKPYVVDLRDPWRLARKDRQKLGLKGTIGNLITNVVEPLVLRFASKIICVSEHMCEEYQQAYPHYKSKFTVLPNGYDISDVDGIKPYSYTKFTIVYTGKFRTSEAFRDPGPFFQALKMCCDLGYNIQFVHVGAIEKEVVKLAEQNGIGHLVNFIGPQLHSVALAYAKGANVLLLIGGGQKTEQTGKIFDYIACNRPILALAPPDGEIAKVAKELPYARVLPNSDPKAIAKTLGEMYSQSNSILNRGVSLDLKYSRKCIAGKLGKIFDEIYS
jgi:glycosyltransferase involved in cell wall biosynthesis